MVTYILALAFLNVADAAPKLLEPHKTQDACHAAANARNRKDEGLQTQQARELGAEFVCLKVERAGA